MLTEHLPTDEELDATIRAVFGTTGAQSRRPRVPFLIVRRPPEPPKPEPPKMPPLRRGSWAAKTAARRLGFTDEQYAERIAAGELWCFRHRRWHPAEAFGLDKTRGRGRASACRESRNARARHLYKVARHD